MTFLDLGEFVLVKAKMYQMNQNPIPLPEPLPHRLNVSRHICSVGHMESEDLYSVGGGDSPAQFVLDFCYWVIA